MITLLMLAKHMKQKTTKKQQAWRRPKALMVLSFAGLLLLAFAVPASADRFDEQIRDLQSQNHVKQNAIEELSQEATSYQDVIARLNVQIGQLQSQITANQAEQAKLQKQIEEAQAELDRQRHILGEDIKTMYVDGEPSAIEMLATSRNLSDFVDKAEYRSVVQTKIQDTLKRITKLQAELNDKKVAVERLLEEQRVQQDQLRAGRAEQNRLLTFNQAQQADFNAQIKENNKKVDDLRRQQAEENCRIFGCSGGVLGGGGYPWGFAKCLHTGQVEGNCYNYDWVWNGSIWNYSNGGWGYRNCTDWVAFRSGGKVPSAGVIRAHAGDADAKYWDDAARSMGRQVDSLPTRGDTAVSNAGGYGHVLYVNDVYEDGSISLSDYNRAGTGKYDSGTFEKVGDGSYRSPTGRVYSLTFVTW
jgi:surface antigen/peptidoglycan hydrolase CwlO-like protein